MNNNNLKLKIRPAYSPNAVQAKLAKQAEILHDLQSSRLDDFAFAEPLLFYRKQKKQIKVIPLKEKTSDTGYIRHFTPAVQE
jgi:hypothetical protein